MKIAMILVTMLVGTISWAQSGADEAAIRDILKEEVAAWNKAAANAYSQHFATDGTFTNLLGSSFKGGKRSERDMSRFSAEHIVEAPNSWTSFRLNSSARMLLL
jgi:hypothetical protein